MEKLNNQGASSTTVYGDSQGQERFMEVDGAVRENQWNSGRVEIKSRESREHEKRDITVSTVFQKKTKCGSRFGKYGKLKDRD